MPYERTEAGRALNSGYQRAWYNRNRPKKIKLNKLRKDDLRTVIELLKVERGCEICGYNVNPGGLHFHHVDPDAKVYGIAMMVSHTHKIESIMMEINKCVLVCANCHSEIHAGIVEL